ncbi:hypothetical protein ACFC0A_08020, partial [Kitasatospora purpeofusca]
MTMSPRQVPRKASGTTFGPDGAAVADGPVEPVGDGEDDELGGTDRTGEGGAWVAPPVAPPVADEAPPVALPPDATAVGPGSGSSGPHARYAPYPPPASTSSTAAATSAATPRRRRGAPSTLPEGVGADSPHPLSYKNHTAQ